ncbi:MAG TPA: dephospho-CoA kinase [Firmicutes bacterium]|nr:dephospho-CoA kinase [Bacillota bacterium]
MLVVGLTGGIASGKSTVANHLRSLGAYVVDCDRIARQVVEPGKPALAAIVEEFGPEMLQGDGSLNRRRLGELVFREPDLRRRLEEITHPYILARMDQEIAKHADGSDVPVIVDVPLLYEQNLAGRFDRVIVVYAPESLQLERLMRRDGLSRDEAWRRIRAQMPMEEKRQLADYVLDNRGGLEALKTQVETLWKELKLIAHRTHCPRSKEG